MKELKLVKEKTGKNQITADEIDLKKHHVSIVRNDMLFYLTKHDNGLHYWYNGGHRTLRQEQQEGQSLQDFLDIYDKEGLMIFED